MYEVQLWLEFTTYSQRCLRLVRLWMLGNPTEFAGLGELASVLPVIAAAVLQRRNEI